MEADRLFLHTLDDLEQRTTSIDEYTVLKSAALLRQLLLDGGNLTDQVNRNHKLKLRYQISDISPFETLIHNTKPEFWTIEDALDPESPLAYKPYDATVKQFLARRVMYFRGTSISIRDVIDQLANIGGAVHYDNARNERHRALQAAEHFYGREGLPGVLSQMRLIGRITIRGLSPLRDAVVASGAATWASVDDDGLIELKGDHEAGTQ